MDEMKLFDTYEEIYGPLTEQDVSLLLDLQPIFESALMEGVTKEEIDKNISAAEKERRKNQKADKREEFVNSVKGSKFGKWVQNVQGTDEYKRAKKVTRNVTPETAKGIKQSDEYKRAVNPVYKARKQQAAGAAGAAQAAQAGAGIAGALKNKAAQKAKEAQMKTAAGAAQAGVGLAGIAAIIAALIKKRKKMAAAGQDTSVIDKRIKELRTKK